MRSLRHSDSPRWKTLVRKTKALSCSRKLIRSLCSSSLALLMCSVHSPLPAGYVLSGAFSKGGDSSALGVLLNVLGRTCISTPLHVLTGYLIGLQVIPRDILGEPLGITS